MNDDVLDQVSPEIAQLRALVAATGEVIDGLALLESCRFGPSPLILAAVTDLRGNLDELARLGPQGGKPSLSALQDAATEGNDRHLTNVLASTVRANVSTISERSGALSLELRQLLADTGDVVSMATGSAGTYDATGRTAVGQLRRTRGSL